MSQPKLNIVDLDVSRKYGDEVSSAGTNGNVLSAAERLGAINRARGTVFTEIFNNMGMNDFLSAYPEFLKMGTGVSLSSLPLEIRKVIRVLHNGELYLPVPGIHQADALNDPFSKWSSGNYFIQLENKVEFVGGGTPSTATVYFARQPVDIAGFGGGNPDLIEPYTWLGLITAETVRVLLSDEQIV